MFRLKSFAEKVQPIEESLTPLVLGNFHSVVQAPESGAPCHEGFELFEMIVLNGKMPIATGAENDDCIRSLQHLRVFGPASRLNHHMHTGHALQAVLDQHATGLVLVL